MSVGLLARALLLTGLARGATDDKIEYKEKILVVDGDNNPFALHMFENFELTKGIFVKEQKLVRELRELRTLLLERQRMVAAALDGASEVGEEEEDGGSAPHENPVDAFNLLKRLLFARMKGAELERNLLSSQGLAEDWLHPRRRNDSDNAAGLRYGGEGARKDQGEDDDDHGDDDDDLPSAKDFKGALNGLVILYDTYLFDQRSLEEEGRIRIEGFASGDEVDIAAAHNLTADDFGRLALHAYEKTW